MIVFLPVKLQAINANLAAAPLQSPSGAKLRRPALDQYQ